MINWEHSRVSTLWLCNVDSFFCLELKSLLLNVSKCLKSSVMSVSCRKTCWSGVYHMLKKKKKKISAQQTFTETTKPELHVFISRKLKSKMVPKRRFSPTGCTPPGGTSSASPSGLSAQECVVVWMQAFYRLPLESNSATVRTKKETI